MIGFLRRQVKWIAFNLIAAAAYLVASSTIWDRDPVCIPGASMGDPLIWAQITLFFFVPLLVTALIWAALIVKRGLKTGSWRASLVFLGAVCAWLALVCFSAWMVEPC